jgi:hypothetical protein
LRALVYFYIVIKLSGHLRLGASLIQILWR